MIYILETNLSNKKNMCVALKQVFGIGTKQSEFICKRLGFSANINFNQLTKEQVKKIKYFVETSKIQINTDLKYEKRIRKQKLIEMRTTRGIKNSIILRKT